MRLWADLDLLFSSFGADTFERPPSLQLTGIRSGEALCRGTPFAGPTALIDPYESHFW